MKKMPASLEGLLRNIATACAKGRINWNTKEYLCDVALAMFDWTREDLRAYNRERAEGAHNDSH